MKDKKSGKVVKTEPVKVNSGIVEREIDLGRMKASLRSDSHSRKMDRRGVYVVEAVLDIRTGCAEDWAPQEA